MRPSDALRAVRPGSSLPFAYRYGSVTANPLVELADRNVAVLLAALGLEPAPTQTPTTRPTSCAWCGGPIRVASTGRPARFCSATHRHRAWLAAREH